MKYTRFLVAVFVIALFASGCSTVGVIKTDDTDELPKNVPPINSANVKVYSVKDIGEPYTVLGSVVAGADAVDNSYVPIKLLREQATRLGADAIVGLRLEIQVGFWSSAIRASGIAVKLNNGGQNNASAK